MVALLRHVISSWFGFAITRSSTHFADFLAFPPLIPTGLFLLLCDQLTDVCAYGRMCFPTYVLTDVCAYRSMRCFIRFIIVLVLICTEI